MELRAGDGAVAKGQARCSGIEGRVTTPEVWLIPRARIFFFNEETKKNTSADSDEDGLYGACLSAGAYDVTVNAPGFKNAKRKGIKVNYGEQNVIDFPLNVAARKRHIRTTTQPTEP